MANLKTVDADCVEPDQIEVARQAVAILARPHARQGVRIETAQPDADGQRQSVILPASAVGMLTDILSFLAAGRSVTVVPDNHVLTTNQAAEMLQVSRPYLIRLLDQKAIPHTMVGTHRRLRLQDVLAYRTNQMDGRNAAAEALLQQAQELDMGY